MSFQHQFPADVNHVVPDAFAVEQPGDTIHAETLGNRAEVEHHARVGLDDFSLCIQLYLVDTHELAQAVDGQ